MKGALDVHRELLALDVPHEIVRLPRIVLAADELPDALGVAAERCLGVRLLEVDDDLVGVLAPVNSIVDDRAILTVLHGHEIRPAAPAAVNTATDYAAGLVPPLPLPREVILLNDASVGGTDVVYVPTGEAGTALGIRADLLLAASRARPADVTRTRRSAHLRSAGGSSTTAPSEAAPR